MYHMFILGYDAIGYGMSKPNLRAELEADLKEYGQFCFCFSKILMFLSPVALITEKALILQGKVNHTNVEYVTHV